MSRYDDDSAEQCAVENQIYTLEQEREEAQVALALTEMFETRTP